MFSQVSAVMTHDLRKVENSHNNRDREREGVRTGEEREKQRNRERGESGEETACFSEGRF